MLFEKSVNLDEGGEAFFLILYFYYFLYIFSFIFIIIF